MSAAPRFTLPEAPTYRPTPEQFQDPLAYIASIRREAEAYGICKIVPPEGWKPPFAIDHERFRFRTRIQAVSELMVRGTNVTLIRQFREDYSAFLQRTKQRKFKKNPVFGGVEVELYRFFTAVRRRGGYEAVSRDRRWRDIARILKIPQNTNSSVAYNIRLLYQKLLLDYELYTTAKEEGRDFLDIIKASTGLIGDPDAQGRRSDVEIKDEEEMDALEALAFMQGGFPMEEAEADAGDEEQRRAGDHDRRRRGRHGGRQRRQRQRPARAAAGGRGRRGGSSSSGSGGGRRGSRGGGGGRGPARSRGRRSGGRGGRRGRQRPPWRQEGDRSAAQADAQAEQADGRRL
jgi:hypothetical protein